MDYNTGETRDLVMNVDPEKLTRSSSMRGDGVWVDSLDVWLRPDPNTLGDGWFVVDYQASELCVVK